MRLISLELKNIRSYRDLKLEFPGGITLLSGDIGAGKSTLLHAIEFALFGLSRGELVGSALLRHGASDGRVTLSFSTDAVYSITRTLKRNATGVSQDTGWIETVAGREMLTPSELRARVYELLGYPLQFLSKQRNLLYRFTLYTPQEEMKAILIQGSEERLETIRRIFNIDAYRIARDNAHLLAKGLREREQVQEGILPRLQQESERLKQRLARRDELRKQQELFTGERTKFAAASQESEHRVTALERDRAAAQHEQQIAAMQERSRKLIEAELQQLEQRHAMKKRMLGTAQEQRKRFTQALELYTKELDGTIETDMLQESVKQAMQGIEALKQDEGKVLGLIEQCNHGPQVEAGSTCPTCRQSVSAQHINDVRGALAAQLVAAQRKRDILAKRIAVQRQEMARMNAELDRRRQMAEVRTQLTMHEQSVKQHEEEIALIETAMVSKRELAKPPAAQADSGRMRVIEQLLAEAKSVLQRARQQLLEVEKHLARLEQEERELVDSEKRLAEIDAEIQQRRSGMERDAQLRAWVSRQFSPFTATVERHVLMSIHATFDAVFRQWFSRLIEDDALTTRIDHEFAPLMLQHGYETDVAFLSGGERTAVSLAYRLALVHTIHVLQPSLGTSGLIMLDEPTDGFSAEQLERVRDVLQELRMEQIVLVSHEQQLEGFVDHIIRVRKTGDGSVVEIAV
jgi:exonuclease SbcC